jgi:hypothetical protein
MEARTDVAAIGGTYFGLKGKYFMTNFQTWISDNSSIMGYEDIMNTLEQIRLIHLLLTHVVNWLTCQITKSSII